ncbi:MAG: class A beta-lactamase [Candidatus Obscuribacterales bacterium]|nr:class A beta-lactamase [Candidatus Obscuribacterales bacterium]
MTLINIRLTAMTTGAFCIISLMALPAMPLPTELTTKGVTEAELPKVQGEVGIAVVARARQKEFLLNQNKLFPMQSVAKLPVSIAILRLADQGKLSLQDKITVHTKDVLTVNSPIKEAIKGTQTDFTIKDLIARAICDSDNTACDVLINRAGGAAAVTRILKEVGVEGVRVDRPEKVLQSQRLQVRQFLDDPRDTTTPQAMVDLLEKLYSGKLLSKGSTKLLLEDLFNCKTGINRIRAGLPVGWKLAHKTGTGSDVAGQNTGTNDVGIMVGPTGEVIYIAIFIKGSRAKIGVREAFMTKVAAKAAVGAL